MSEHTINLDRLFDLVGTVCDGDALQDELTELDSIVFADQVAGHCYLRYCRMHSALVLELRAHRATQLACQQIDIESGESVPDDFTVVMDAPAILPFGFLSAICRGTIGFFSQELPLSLLIATVLTGLGLWFASMIYVSSPDKVAKNSAPPVQSSFDPPLEIVGRITDMVDCKWADPQTETSSGANVLLGRKYVLVSGLLEITYDAGAKVILQGPVKYEVEPNGGYLAAGKLTGKLEKKPSAVSDPRSEKVASGQWSVAGESAPKSPISNPQSPTLNPLFTIHTPAATVTDLGTEFGVEVTEDRQSWMKVYDGRVMVRVNSTATPQREAELTQGDVAHVKPHGELICYRGSQSQSVPKSLAFVRSIALPRSLIAYWPMNEGTGRVAADRTNNRITGYLQARAGWTKGRFGDAVKLADVDQYVRCVADSKLNLGTGDFTFSVWFKGGCCPGTEAMPFRFLLCYNAVGTPGSPSLAIMTKSDKICVHAGEGWITDVFPGGGLATFDNTHWHHVALVRKAGMATAYVNGKQDAVGRCTADLHCETLVVGGAWNGATGVKGAVDDAAIWNQALTATQVKALADGTATPLNVLQIDSSPTTEGQSETSKGVVDGKEAASGHP